MKRLTFTVAAAGVLASAGLMTGVAVSHADTFQTEGSYPSRQACLDAGPAVQAATPPFNWNNFWCIPDHQTFGNWRLVLSNN
ncbi:hypothetical protein MBOU_10230 [Mycobacterium bourgelatii]|uniref:Uncharacterized protein n=2 Tax=Mycobacterium bourgelatii TaxID=1273442 RepID=A0A7I9YJX7_MYCBU|nr:hypothetical protein MBOU_10230 [Mycobacterium bourgelatii]